MPDASNNPSSANDPTFNPVTGTFPASDSVSQEDGQNPEGRIDEQTTAAETSNTADLSPTSVWLGAQICSRDQRKGRYVPASIYHPGKMLPAIARQAIATYTTADDIVADPMAGIGTTLVEAIHAGRHAVGTEYESRWADLAAENIRHAHANGATGTAHIWHADGRSLPDLVPADLQGKVALVVTSPPYGPSTHGRAYTGPYRTGSKILKAHHRYGTDPANLAYAELDKLAAAFTDILCGCANLLRPGGRVVITARPYRWKGELVDIPGMVLAAGRAAGLTPVDRCIALLCGVRDGRLIPRGSFFQIHNARQSSNPGTPLHVVSHEDVLILARPSTDSRPDRNS